MNSLRPLITISILGIICLLLYMKINETEPVIPSEVAEWDMSADLGNLDIGGPTEMASADVGAVDIGGAAQGFDVQGASPELGAAPSFQSAPALNIETTSTPTASAEIQSTQIQHTEPVNADQNMSSPPAFVATPPADKINLAPAKTDGAAPSALGAPLAASKPSDSKLPPLPALPAIAAGAAAVAHEALSDSSAEVKTKLDPAATTPAAPPTTNSVAAPTFPSFGGESPVASTESIQADANTTAGQASLFSATRLAAQSALDRGELSQALLLLSDWYGDPSLSPAEADEVQALLSQLAGSVIYSTEHRLEPPYMVQAGEKLEDIAQKYNVPWQLLAKVNGLSGPEQLQPGQQLKVLRGPFSARIDLSERKMVLMLDRRYAGQFSLEVEPTTSIEEGNWAVNQKLLTPANVGVINSASATASEERSILLTSTGGATNQVTILRGAGPATPAATDPAGRVIQLKTSDVQDVYDILTLGSQVTIRR